jgi:hypothetical protein
MNTLIQRLKLAIVRSLNTCCTAVDAVAYRPAVVKLTEALPSWWQCQLAHLSIDLDRRWQTGYWASEQAPAAPNGPCDACGRRAAWLLVGGHRSDEELRAESRSYLDDHTVELCGWCRLADDVSLVTRGDLEDALRVAKERSVAWRWQ